MSLAHESHFPCNFSPYSKSRPNTRALRCPLLTRTPRRQPLASSRRPAASLPPPPAASLSAARAGPPAVPRYPSAFLRAGQQASTSAPGAPAHSPLHFIPSREKREEKNSKPSRGSAAAAARRNELVRGGGQRRGGRGVRGRYRQGAPGADAAQAGGVPPRAGLRAAAAGRGRRRAALPLRVPRPPQPPRALPVHAHPGTSSRACFLAPPSKIEMLLLLVMLGLPCAWYLYLVMCSGALWIGA